MKIYWSNNEDGASRRIGAFLFIDYMTSLFCLLFYPLPKYTRSALRDEQPSRVHNTQHVVVVHLLVVRSRRGTIYFIQLQEKRNWKEVQISKQQQQQLLVVRRPCSFAPFFRTGGRKVAISAQLVVLPPAGGCSRVVRNLWKLFGENGHMVIR